MSKRTYNPIPQATPVLPANAVGFIGRRVDRPERLALFHANGTLSNTFGIEETEETIGEQLRAHGMRLIEGGVVVR